MKIRVLDRILVAVAGLILIAACVGLVAQVFFGADVAGAVTGALSVNTIPRKILIGVVAAILLILGVYCLSVLFRHPGGKDKFVFQKLEKSDPVKTGPEPVHAGISDPEGRPLFGICPAGLFYGRSSVPVPHPVPPASFHRFCCRSRLCLVG